ncbi:MAG: hypothetical protein DMG24_16010 [Acidobacteria bacterium]|nr:MAG: hypothetical protein DMG24_16010 [Acidobacteriota bacterium]
MQAHSVFWDIRQAFVLRLGFHGSKLAGLAPYRRRSGGAIARPQSIVIPPRRIVKIDIDQGRERKIVAQKQRRERDLC